MGFHDITRVSVLQAVREFDAEGRDAFLERHGFGPARRYYLVLDDRQYDSKAIVGVAHGYARPELGPLRSRDFNGGHATVEALLTRLGFSVRVLDDQDRTHSSTRRDPAWHLEIGATISRAALHDRYGGTREGGIAPSRRTDNVLVFTDPSVGAQHGYFDHWEGVTLHYTGEGRSGDQQMARGNKAIRDHVGDGRALRVFEGVAGVVTYIGEFSLDPAEPWYTARAPSSGGGPVRNVLIFRLVPAGAFLQAGQRRDPTVLAPSLSTTYRPADERATISTGTPAQVDPDIVDRGTRGHRVTQNALAAHLPSRGLTPLSPGLGDPAFDVGWWDQDTLHVAEVKSLSEANETGQLRLGLGQLLDYEDTIRRSGRKTRPVLAVEGEPSTPRWQDLCAHHGVTLTWPPGWRSI
jgi:hypothetical protein